MLGEAAELQRALLEEALECDDNSQEDGGRTLDHRRVVHLRTQASLLPL